MSDLHQRYHEKIKSLFEQSAGWLEGLYHAEITPPVAALLAQAEDANNTLEIAREKIQMAIALAQQSMKGSAEIPEVMTRGGIILFRRQDLKGARDLLAQARPLFTAEKLSKKHRGAVTDWLLGIIHTLLGDPIEGYKHWKSARKDFCELEKIEAWEKRWEKAQWYQDHLASMEIWAAQTLPEIYFGWMNQFDTQLLPAGLIEIRSKIEHLYSQGMYPEVRKHLELFLRNAQRKPGLMAYRVALVDAAYYEYLLGDIKEAIAHLDQARVGFQLSHRGAVALWMAGMLRWWVEAEQADAEMNWQESIRQFGILAERAEHANEGEKRAWYERQIPRMAASLQEWIWLVGS